MKTRDVPIIFHISIQIVTYLLVIISNLLYFYTDWIGMTIFSGILCVPVCLFLYLLPKLHGRTIMNSLLSNDDLSLYPEEAFNPTVIDEFSSYSDQMLSASDGEYQNSDNIIATDQSEFPILPETPDYAKKLIYNKRNTPLAFLIFSAFVVHGTSMIYFHELSDSLKLSFAELDLWSHILAPFLIAFPLFALLSHTNWFNNFFITVFFSILFSIETILGYFVLPPALSRMLMSIILSGLYSFIAGSIFSTISPFFDPSQNEKPESLYWRDITAAHLGLVFTFCFAGVIFPPLIVDSGSDITRIVIVVTSVLATLGLIIGFHFHYNAIGIESDDDHGKARRNRIQGNEQNWFHRIFSFNSKPVRVFYTPVLEKTERDGPLIEANWIHSINVRTDTTDSFNYPSNLVPEPVPNSENPYETYSEPF